MARNRAERGDAEETGQVLSFRRRSRLDPAPLKPAASDPPDKETEDGLARYERDVDYRQRMLMNVIAIAVVAALVGVGVWIADIIADMEKYQDCVLQGRGNCAPIATPASRPR